MIARLPLFAILLTKVIAIASASDQSSFYLQGSLVHRVAQGEVTKEYPVIMIPGHHLSSAIYLHTPDGRDGWAQHFAEAGYEVFVINDPKFDFSRGFSVPGFTEVPSEGAPLADPDASRPWQEDIWRRWGFGPSAGEPYPDSRFPNEAFAVFQDDYPWISKSRESFSGNIASLLQAKGPAILLTHSAGGPEALAAASQHPALVASLVLVEPTGPPTEADFPTFSALSMLGVYGDYIDSRRQTSRKDAVEAAALLFERNGGTGDVISLPEDYEIRGNSHLLMQARNNRVISDLVIAWLDEYAAPPESDPSPRSRGSGKLSGIFTTLDEDGDGSLSLAEFGAGQRYREANPETVGAAFAEIDLDEDGKVSLEELGANLVGGKSKARRGDGKGGGKGNRSR